MLNQKKKYSNANMDFIIVRFVLSLFVFRAVNSEILKPSNIVNDIILNTAIENIEHGNTTLLSTTHKHTELIKKIKHLELQYLKLRFGNDLLTCLISMTGLHGEIGKQITKMLGDIEEVRYFMMKSLKKQKKLFAEGDSNNDIGIADLFRLEAREQVIQEYTEFLIQLKTLKFEIYEWNKKNDQTWKKYDDVSTTVHKIIHNEDVPKISPNDANNEDLLPKFDDDVENDQLEKLQRLSLMIQDQLHEMPKPENEDQEANEKSETDPQNKSPKNAEVPRWLLNERDIEELRSKYIIWLRILDNTQNPGIAVLREKIEKSGFTLKLFCKTFIEYYNITSIILECTSKDNLECVDMMITNLDQERFKKFAETFMEWQALGIENMFS